MKWCLILLSACFSLSPLAGEEIISRRPIKFDFSSYFYKVITLKDWHATEGRERVFLSDEDETSIRLGRKNQIEKMVARYKKYEDVVVVLKIHKDKIIGEIEFRESIDRFNGYYYLQDGFIPFEAVMEARIVYLNHVQEIENSLSEPFQEVVHAEFDSSGN
ncbi:MAG: hypothetical protein A3E80_03225 [Chlamydiae bacterium RIFCSPHIGHO2_12_FULL_49_9]|nr:MAG: hypothetical protein A3E80_03225 [Chlamydiae bacterium RIFCSPHIGHO2_12_FULL_49_9]